MISTTQVRKYPVIEVFGPTIQGEGYLIGAPVHFIRFGGCDYRCSWCDSKYAVIPSEVHQHSKLMNDQNLITALEKLGGSPEWVVISGGNPALQHLDSLVEELHVAGYKIAVETQGTIFREWLREVDHVTVSPKPPSSGMDTDMDVLDQFLSSLDPRRIALKVVVFDGQDYEFARKLYQLYKELPVSLSVGNDVGSNSVSELLDRWRWLSEKTVVDPLMGSVRVLPQAHVLLWGNRRGV